MDMSRAAKKIEWPDMHIPSWGWTRQHSCFSSYTINKCLIWSLFNAPPHFSFFAFLCFFWWFCYFKRPPKHSDEVLSSVPKHKKVAVGLGEKIHVLHELHSGVSYSAVGHEFNVSESTIYIRESVFKEKHIKQGYVLIGWQKCCNLRLAGTWPFYFP